MKNYKKPFILTTALCMASASLAQAGTLTVINKIPDQRIQLFIRGEGSESHAMEVIEGGEQQDLIIEEKHVNGKPTFEVIASTGNGGDPDWKLMGGKCEALVTAADHTILIESNPVGKTVCRNVTAENPPTGAPAKGR
jgi:hypothetical protein